MDVKLPSGFETINRLLGYCEIHSETERHLFHRDHVNAVLELAGDSRRVIAQFVEVSDKVMKPLIAQARVNIRRNSIKLVVDNTHGNRNQSNA